MENLYVVPAEETYSLPILESRANTAHVKLSTLLASRPRHLSLPFRVYTLTRTNTGGQSTPLSPTIRSFALFLKASQYPPQKKSLAKLNPFAKPVFHRQHLAHVLAPVDPSSHTRLQ